MHRFLRVLPVAALLTAVPLAACSGDDDDDDTPVTGGETEQTITIPGESPDNTGPATSGNDSSITNAPDNGAGTVGGDDTDSGTDAPAVATTSG